MKDSPPHSPEKQPSLEAGVLPRSVFATPRVVMNIDNCFFYHTMNIPGHGVVPGHWNIRGNESQYLGDVEFTNKRVLEIGPASGLLTFFMERQGAEVVSVEAVADYAWEFYWDLPESAPEDLGTTLGSHRDMMEKVRNSYWLSHRVLCSNAKVHYGSAYSLPEQLGKFDIAVLACMLLHNKNPLAILEGCARVTRETMIVVDACHDSVLPQSSIELIPADNRHCWHTWWKFSPSFLVRVLRSMGFPHHRVSFHTQTCLGEPVKLFTLVASRKAPAELSLDEGSIDVVLDSVVERLKIEANGSTHVPVSILNLSAVPLSSFSEFPVRLSYHWRQEPGEVVVWDGIRTCLPRILGKGDKEALLIAVRAPEVPGSYWLEVSMVKEGVTWFDGVIPRLPLRIETVVTPQRLKRA